jgi:hypothetical protein
MSKKLTEEDRAARRGARAAEKVAQRAKLNAIAARLKVPDEQIAAMDDEALAVRTCRAAGTRPSHLRGESLVAWVVKHYAEGDERGEIDRAPAETPPGLWGSAKWGEAFGGPLRERANGGDE